MYDRVYMCSCILHVRMYTYLSYIYPFHTEERKRGEERRGEEIVQGYV